LLARQPGHLAIGEQALGGDLRRAFLAIAIEQAGEQQGLEIDRPLFRQRAHFRPMQVRKWRDEIKKMHRAPGTLERSRPRMG